MKRQWIRLIACGLCAAMITGCTAGGKNTAAKTETGTKTEAGTKTETGTETVSGKGTDLTDAIKTKYAAAEIYDYAEPLYNVPKDYVFTYDNVPDEFWFSHVSLYDCFKVYTSNDFEVPENIKIEGDIDTNDIKISPNMMFDYTDPEGCIATDGTWGSNSKFWLVQSMDLKTGEKLEKPLVTIFTISQELDTPTLTQSVSSEGYYQLDWTPVEGADYYEVYDRSSESYAECYVTTKETTCNYEEFDCYYHKEKKAEKEKKKQQGLVYSVNSMMSDSEQYFVVAKSDDGKSSAMSNHCKVADIANQIPVRSDIEFETKYNGDSVLDLPADIKVEMLDGSIEQFLIDYHGAVVKAYENGNIGIQATIKNLCLSINEMFFTGMDYDAFMADANLLTEREDSQQKNSVTANEDINIPYVPSKEDTADGDENAENPGDTEEAVDTEEPENPGETEDSEEPENPGETEEPEEPEDPEESEDPEEPENPGETEEPEDPEEPENPGETEEPEDPEEPENPGETENPAEPEDPGEPEESGSTEELSAELSDTVFANSALSEWIAVNMLQHKESISLDEFPEASDTDTLRAACTEAYRQNPLTGIISSLNYDYAGNNILVEYVLSQEETESMQQESLKKAQEIAESITEDGMSDFEKESAINQYLCDNASYNEAIMDYIQEDGTISGEVTYDFANSFTPYGVLIENVGVCESYSEAFQLIARAAGLESIINTGRLENVSHEWNRVNIDGAWYTLDVTNNDNENVPNCYFNISDEFAADILIEDGNNMIPSYLENYRADNMENEYYTRNGWYSKDNEEAAATLQEMLKEDSRAAVRLDAACDVDSIMQQVVTGANLTDGLYYYNAGVLSIITK